MNNLEVRQAIAKNRLKYWEVAQALGVTGSTFSVWLRTEMDQDRKEAVLKAIASIKM